jgi:hypothetical protein
MDRVSRVDEVVKDKPLRGAEGVLDNLIHAQTMPGGR